MRHSHRSAKADFAICAPEGVEEKSRLSVTGSPETAGLQIGGWQIIAGGFNPPSSFSPLLSVTLIFNVTLCISGSTTCRCPANSGGIRPVKALFTNRTKVQYAAFDNVGKNASDYVTRRFNASSAGLKCLGGWTYAGKPDVISCKYDDGGVSGRAGPAKQQTKSANRESRKSGHAANCGV